MAAGCLLPVALLAGLLVQGAARADDLAVVAALNEPPGNITVTPEGRIILSLHQFFAPRDRVVELRKDGTLAPFPNESWNRPDAEAGPLTLDSVLGLRSDTRGVVWLLDNGLRGGAVPKLVAWNTRANRLFRVIYLPPPVTATDSFVNDLQVDVEHESIYIADPAGGRNAALIVVDTRTGAARRALEGREGVIPEDIDMVVDGRAIELSRPDGTATRPRIGVNPIALDAKSEWLYFGPMSGAWLYRVRTRDLRDGSLPADELARRVERYAERPICDGASIDRENNIYITEIAGDAIGVIDAKDRTYRRLFQDAVRLSWPDALSFDADGNLLAVANQLHRAPPLNGGTNGARPPFHVVKFRGLAPGVCGR